MSNNEKQFDHSRHTCTGTPCRFLSEHEQDPSSELAARLHATREARREQVRKIRRGI